MTVFRVILIIASIAVVGAVLTYSIGPTPSDPPPDAQKPVSIGLITNNPNGLLNIDGFRQGMQAFGYLEGVNATYLFSGAATPQAQLQAAIEDMVANGADLIFTAGTPTGVAAMAATKGKGVPVVFGVIADPIVAGVMADLDRPGGNLTGVMLSPNQARRLEILINFLPNVHRVLLPYNPNDAAPQSAVEQLEAVASILDLSLVHAHARGDDQVQSLLENLPEDIDAIFMLPDSTVNQRVSDLITAANARHLPISAPSMVQAEAGALLAYGIVHQEVGLQAAHIADRILRGTAPGSLPVETADFYLTVNIAAANRLGIELSEEVLQQADVIIRADALSN